MFGVAAILAIWSAVAVQARPGLLGSSGLGGGLSGIGGGLSGIGGLGHGLGGLGQGLGGGGGGGGSAPISLSAVPGADAYGGLSFASVGLQELGTVYEGSVPSQTIKVTNTIPLKIPQPYPVKVPHNVPVPVSVPQPYPVPVTKLVRVPQAVPVEVVKHVPVPVEVPKPYPVPSNELQGGGSGGLGGFGGGFGGHQQLTTSYGEPIQGGYSSGGYDSYASQTQNSGYDSVSAAEADQSAAYPAVAAAESESNYGAQDETGHSA